MTLVGKASAVGVDIELVFRYGPSRNSRLRTQRSPKKLRPGPEMAMEAHEMYAPARRNVRLEDCSFYHRMELPGVGLVGDQWDLRADVDQYLGNVDFRGKRVLDIGAASGYLTFEMEKRGADVVSFDMADGRHWNLVPHVFVQDSFDGHLSGMAEYYERLRNAYWFAHEKLNSKAQAYYGDVYRIPEDLGQFDIVFFGMILGHLRDPFQALFSASRLCSGSMLVTNQWLGNRLASIQLGWLNKYLHRMLRSSRRNKLMASPYAVFMPTIENGEVASWWALSEKCIDNMLQILGFEPQSHVLSRPQCLVEGRHRKETCLATRAHRARGQALGIRQGPQRKAA